MSPYSGYNGQLLTSVYQPTEMALMHKGPVSDTWGWPPPGCHQEGDQAVGGFPGPYNRVPVVGHPSPSSPGDPFGAGGAASAATAPCAPQSEGPYDVILPRASTASPAAGSASSTLRAEDAFAVQARHAGAQRDGRSGQVG